MIITCLVFIREIELRPDDADGDVVMKPALADSGVQQWRLIAGVCADQQDDVGFFDSADGDVVMKPALADSGVQQWRLIAGVCADQQDDVGFFDSADASVQ